MPEILYTRQYCPFFYRAVHDRPYIPWLIRGFTASTVTEALPVAKMRGMVGECLNQ